MSSVGVYCVSLSVLSVQIHYILKQIMQGLSLVKNMYGL